MTGRKGRKGVVVKGRVGGKQTLKERGRVMVGVLR